MGRRWYLMAAVAGTLAAAAVWAWPSMPRWTTGPDAGRLEGFSPDGAVLVTSRTLLEGGAFGDPQVNRWDTVTGRCLSRARLSCAEPTTVKIVRPSPDGRLALVGEGPLADVTVLNFTTGHWYLHDAVTGRRRAGPLRGIAYVDVSPFSPDGRWFWGLRGDPHGGFPLRGGADIFSATTDEVAVGLPDRTDLTATGCHFAPDGETAAVLWRASLALSSFWPFTSQSRCRRW